MGISNKLGEIGEIQVVAECLTKGYRVAFPFGHDWKYDLIVERNGKLERVQVKTVRSNGDFVKVMCETSYSTGNKQPRTKYIQQDFDWLVCYDVTTKKCYYLPSSLLGTEGKSAISIRLTPTKNKQVQGIRWAKDYLDW